MFTSLPSRLKKAGRWLPMLLLPVMAQAQGLNYLPAGAQNVAGTFTDLGSFGTVITTANTDDANSAAQPIGFNFSYNGTTFTQFVLNTNGLIRLGAAAPSVANIFLSQDQSPTQTAVDPISSTNAANVNLIMPFNTDLVSGTSAAEYRVVTTGAAGSQVCTIQWKNVSDKAGVGTDTAPTQYSNMTFQVKLYEGSNNIEFVYGPTVASTNAATSRFPSVGIKGSNDVSSVLGNKTTGAAAWSTTVFINGPYTTTTHNFRNSATPDLGRTYRFVPAVLPGTDVAVTSLYTLGKVSSTYNSPVTVRAVVSNVGSSARTNLPVTLNVTGATTVTNSVQTVASLAPGATATVTFTYPVTATSGVNTVTVTVPTDDVATNNSQTYSQTVTVGNMAYVDATQPLNAAGVGVGVPNGVLVARYTLSQAGTVSSITPTFVGAGTANTTYQVQLYDASGAGGTPGTVLYTSTTQTRPGASGSPVISVPSIAIPAGDFFVGIKELNNNVALAYQVENPLRPTTFYYQVPGGAWTPVNNTTLRTRLALEVGVAPAPACAPVQSLTATAITTTGANLTFTGLAGATYTVTYQAAGGPIQTITPTPTGSPVVLTGLTANTSYTVTVVTNCAGGATSPANTFTFSTLLPPAAYAPAPYSTSFEPTWTSAGGTRNVPSNNWRSDPTTGDNSWRRSDDGASAAWSFVTGGGYTPLASDGAHSARFHSYGADAGTQGSLDLHMNLSSPGTKVLVFDYINPTGTDRLDVLVSTNGGSTFGTPVLTANVNATWTAKTVTINSTSATTVIRFRATSDFGNDDMGIDTLRVNVLTGTRNEVLAAKVGLYPNPAHRAFTLSVPAGTLHNASAILFNSLGQMVQERKLNLPAAGGDASFDVSSLAAGVYTLQLKTADELVVKRVVIE